MRGLILCRDHIGKFRMGALIFRVFLQSGDASIHAFLYFWLKWSSNSLESENLSTNYLIFKHDPCYAYHHPIAPFSPNCSQLINRLLDPATIFIISISRAAWLCQKLKFDWEHHKIFRWRIKSWLHCGIRCPYPPTLYRAGPSRYMGPHSNEPLIP